MSLFDNTENLHLLKNLLNPKKREEYESDSDEDEPLVTKNNLNPGSIGPQATTNLKPESSKKEKAPKSIEEWEQMQQQEDAEILETRKCPEYTLTYKQAVGTEDLFLQLGNRTNASASCEDLLLEILLPEETTPADKMDLSITEMEVDLATPIYRLKLPLMHKVNVDRCRAKYEAEQRKLTLTLRLERELDFVNF